MSWHTLSRLRPFPLCSRVVAAGSAVLGMLLAPHAAADPGAASEIDFTELSLEELDSVSISAASKRSQPLFETPAAVSVLFPSDIRRTGHNSVAEALRLVPGIHIVNALPEESNVGVRGANGIQSTKLLVLVDGRSIYGPFYGGVEWGNAEVFLDDLARVEVVRGPGATLWGGNAVNGIINVISKDARESQGSLLSLRSGSAEALHAYARHGGKAGENTWYRVSVSGRDSDGAFGSLRNDPLSGYNEQRAGLRTDSVLSERFLFTTQLDHLSSSRCLMGNESTHRMSSVLSRLTGDQVLGGHLQVQFYVDVSRDRAGDSDQVTGGLPFAFNEDTSNFDLDLTHSFQLGESNDFVVGGGARQTRNTISESTSMRVREPVADMWLYNVFAQDTISFWSKRLQLTLGAKGEHHDSIGWVALPNARLSWLPNKKHTVWAAASQAARAPSRGEREVMINLSNLPIFPAGVPMRVEIMGDPQFREEINNASEIGWRWKPTPRFQTDVTAYYFDYDNVRSLSENTTIEPGNPPTVVQRFTINNSGDAVVYGGEASWLWRIGDTVELGGGLSRTVAHTFGLSETPLIITDYAIPEWLWHVRAWFDLPKNLEFSTALYGVGRNHRVGQSSYERLDVQIAWRPRPTLEVSLGVQNASDPKHSESILGHLAPSVEVRRNIYTRLQWRF